MDGLLNNVAVLFGVVDNTTPVDEDSVVPIAAEPYSESGSWRYLMLERLFPHYFDLRLMTTPLQILEQAGLGGP